MSTPQPRPNWLIALIWLTIFFFLYLLSDKFLDLQFNPNKQVQSNIDQHGMVEISLLRNKAGHYVTEGRVNGTPVTFMLDTGATDVAIPEELAEKLGLEKMQQAFYNTANGVISAHQTRLAQVALGEIKMHNIRGSIVPNMNKNEILLGMSFLKHLEFTQRGNVLILRQHPQ